jgi:tetratricopeptide (TPR) repeat protein
MEAETLRVETSSSSKPETRQMREAGPQRWSGGAQLLCQTKAGESVTLYLPVAETGRYRLDLYATRAPGLGIAHISLDGQPVGDLFDGYAATATPTGRMGLGKVTLAAGDHALRFDVTGKNDASRGFFLGLDRVDLIPVIEVGDVTISYTEALSPQAQELARVCEEVLLPRRAAYRKLAEALSDEKRVAGRVVDLIGCPEVLPVATGVMSKCQPFLDLPLSMFSDLRLYTDSQLKASGGVSEGIMRVVYRAETDSVDMVFAWSSEEGPQPGATFFPVPLHDDGTFRTHGQTLAEVIASRFDDTIWMAASALHEAAEGVLCAGLRFHQPFARWFNEGAANWVELAIIAECAPDREAEIRTQQLPTAKDAACRSKVNLLAWPQAAYESGFVLQGEEGLASAHYHYSTECLLRLLDGQPRSAFAAIIAKLKGRPAPDTEAICQAIKEVTGRDAKAMLLEYVPDSVRTGLQTGAPSKLAEQGRAALARGDHDTAAECFFQAMAMTPSDVSLNLDYALALRRAGWGKRDSERHIEIAAALVQYDPERSLAVSGAMDAEAWYVLGRAAQLRGRTQEAKELLSKIEEAEQTAAPAPH